MRYISHCDGKEALAVTRRTLQSPQRRIVISSGAFIVLAALVATPARSDIVFSIYLGASQTKPSDLRVVQDSRGNDATMHNVPWQGYPFRFEPYYGLRLTYNPPGHPWTRVAIDFTHYKIYGRTEDSVTQDGRWHGDALSDVGPMRERVQSFEMTHGLNMLGVSVLQNVTPSIKGVYVGGGPVLYFPHSENRVDALPDGDRYNFGGFGFQLHAGARTCAGSRGIYGELKYNEGHPTVSIAQGYAQTTVQTIHELAGFDFGPCRSSP